MEITLQCWVNDKDKDGDVDLGRIFFVKISNTETVFALKEVVKAKNFVRFRDVEAHSLEIYSISSPDNDADLKAILKNWDLTRKGETKLNVRSKLSKCFVPGDKQEPFIIIEGPRIDSHAPAPLVAVPDMTLNCWVRGQSPNTGFSVRISSTQTVGELKEAIKNKKPKAFRDVDPDALTLYQVSLPFDDKIKETLRNLSIPEELLPFKTLSYYFTEAPLHEHIHIVVNTSLPGTLTPPPPAEEDDMLAPLIHSFKLATTLAPQTPSHLAKSKEYLKFQSSDRRMLDCRCAKDQPANTVAPPIQLFNPAFAFFSSKASDPEYKVPKDLKRDVRGLMAQFALIYDGEKSRQSHLQSSLAKVIQRPLISMNNVDNTSPDFVSTGRCGRLQTYLIIDEEKNEFGDGGSDPSVQAAFSFQRIFCQPQNAELRLRCCCPAFAIAHAGPWLTIMGCIITGHCVVQRLTDLLWIPVRSVLDDKQVLRIARVFHALKESIVLLDSWYQHIQNIPPLDESLPRVPHPRFFPSPNAYQDGDSLVRFAYQTPLELDVSCVTYRAKTLGDDPKDIVVKFVTSYGADAHRHMASADLAPQLLYYGRIDVEPDMPSYGDLRMVVMEYVDGNTLNKASEQHKVPQSFESDLRQAFLWLHDADYVFGDLRPPNVMITSEGKVKLIDFDWAGKHGEVEYPAAISSAVSWPEGVQEYEPIRKEHDDAMLNTLLRFIRTG